MTDTWESLSWIWAGLAIALLIFGWLASKSARTTVGLPLAYCYATLFHYIGSISYLSPGYSHLRIDGNAYVQALRFSDQTVIDGMMATALGVGGLLIGYLIVWWQPVPSRAQPLAHIDRAKENRLLTIMIAVGAVGFVVPLLKLDFPLIQAFGQVGRNCAIAAICIGAAHVVLLDRKSNYTHWIAFAAVIPTFYIIAWGFTSYGFIALTIFASFWLAVLNRQRIGSMRFGLGVLGITYILLTLFVGWMSFRFELRAKIDQGASIEERIDLVADAASRIEWLSPLNFDSLDVLNTRLNQYVFVGRMMEWHERVPTLRLNGETLVLAPLAFVPRFIWPDKPEQGGSGFVSKHTGMRLSESTAFGAGPVFEFYANFGYPGVLGGFVFLGILIAWIDRTAARALYDGRFLDFTKWFVVGIAFVVPLADVFFMVNTAIISFLVVATIKWTLNHSFRNPSTSSMTKKLNYRR